MDFCDGPREQEGRQACSVYTTHGPRCFSAWNFLPLNTTSRGQRSCFTYLVKQRWKKRGSRFILYLSNSPFHSSAPDGGPESMAKKSSVLTLGPSLPQRECGNPPRRVSLVLTEQAEKAATLWGESPTPGTTGGHSAASSRAMVWTYPQEGPCS